jgi:hypothetical protein
MRLEPILRAHAFMRVEQPPALWEPDTEDWRFVPLLGEMIAAALAGGPPLEELTLGASNVVVSPSDDAEPAVPPPAEYVAVTVRGATNFGPDDRWDPSAAARAGLLGRLHDRLDAAGARFAYVRRLPLEGSFTVFFARAAREDNLRPTGG